MGIKIWRNQGPLAKANELTKSQTSEDGSKINAGELGAVVAGFTAEIVAAGASSLADLVRTTDAEVWRAVTDPNVEVRLKGYERWDDFSRDDRLRYEMEMRKSQLDKAISAISDPKTLSALAITTTRLREDTFDGEPPMRRFFPTSFGGVAKEVYHRPSPSVTRSAQYRAQVLFETAGQIHQRALTQLGIAWARDIAGAKWTVAKLRLQPGGGKLVEAIAEARDKEKTRLAEQEADRHHHEAVRDNTSARHDFDGSYPVRPSLKTPSDPTKHKKHP